MTTAGNVRLTAYRYFCCALVLVAGLSLTSAAAAGQFRGVRFEITQVSDTTFRFPRGRAGWVRPGATGVVVDPRRRDDLVARFRVSRVDSGLVTAVMTGQTTRIATEHIAVLAEPPKPWYKGITFWAGTVFGMVIGALVAGG